MSAGTAKRIRGVMRSKKRFWQKVKALFGAKSFIAGESIAGLLIALGALVIAGLSLWQSREANRNVAVANKAAQESVKVSKDALAFAEESEAFRSALSLKVAISDNLPPIMSIAPVSGEFVISDTWLAYVHDGDNLQSAYANPTQPGVHDLSPIFDRVNEMFVEYDRANTDADGWDYGGGLLDEGYFPVLVSVEYSFHGVPHFSTFIYELYYERWNHTETPKTSNVCERYTPLRKPRLVRRLNENEDERRALMVRFENWRNEHCPEQTSSGHIIDARPKPP